MNCILKEIDNQIKQENELINQRSTWGILANSFLIISSAIAAGHTSDFILFKFVVPLVGLVISFSAFLGVYAASRQHIYLKTRWKEETNWILLTGDEKKKYVRPFGSSKVSVLGTWSSYLIFVVLVGGWAIVLARTIGLV